MSHSPSPAGLLASAPVVVWFSRHDWLPAQRAELEAAFPGCRLVRDPNVFRDAADILDRFHRLGGTEMVVVASLSVLESLLRLGLRPLRPVMQQLPGPPRTEDLDLARMVATRGRWYRHQGFERVLGVQWEVEPLRPSGEEAVPHA